MSAGRGGAILIAGRARQRLDTDTHPGEADFLSVFSRARCVPTTPLRGFPALPLAVAQEVLRTERAEVRTPPRTPLFEGGR
jgi:hypothetical protein